MKPILTHSCTCSNCGKKAQGIILGNIQLCHECWNEVRDIARVVGPILTAAYQHGDL